MASRTRPACGTMLVFALLAACGPADEARFGAERETPSERPVVWGAAASQRFRVQGMAPARAPKVQWDKPEGWKEVPPRQFRDVNLLVAGSDEAECYLTLGSGGALLMNLNRWYGQMGQPAIAPAAVGQLQRRPFLGGNAYYVEIGGTFTGRDGNPRPDSLLVGLMLPVGQSVTTLKMLGPQALLRQELQAFDTLAASMRLEQGGGDAAGPPPGAGFLKSFRAPEHWQKTEDRPMREVNYQIGDQTECYVSVLGGTGGGLKPNLDRWSNQMGQPPLTQEQVASLPTVDMFGKKALIVRLQGSFTGMGGEKVEDAAMLAAVCMLPQQSVFVKMIGPAAVVDENRQAFLDFCASLEK